MKTVIPDYFYSFRCLAGACPDTCCGPWNIVIDNDTKARYDTMEGPLGDRLRNAMSVVDGEDCIVPVNGRCPMLTEDDLCSVILEQGVGCLSTTCDEHPRFTEIYGGLHIRCLPPHAVPHTGAHAIRAWPFRDSESANADPDWLQPRRWGYA